MDDFEKRLKEDAGKIHAKVSPELRARIDASVHATTQLRPEPKPPTPFINLWWASSLTGLAAAIAVIVVLNWNKPVAPPVEPTAETTVVPRYAEEFQTQFPVTAATAEFTAPLEEELEKLKADLEKATQTVREDIDFNF